jgi:hypothetical protein
MTPFLLKLTNSELGLFQLGHSHYYWASRTGSAWCFPKNKEKIDAISQIFSTSGPAQMVWNLWRLGIHLGQVVGLNKNNLGDFGKAIGYPNSSDCACYIGTPGAYQKAILAVWAQNYVPVIVKMSLSSGADCKIQHEFRTITKLKRIDNNLPIPMVHNLGVWHERPLFTMSPMQGRAMSSAITEDHINWCKRLFHLEKVSFLWSDTLCREEFSISINNLPISVKPIFERSLQLLDNTLPSQELPFGWAQRDFAPWNTRFDKKRLVVFDWENAASIRPPGYDLIHFHCIQLALKSKPFHLTTQTLQTFLRETSPEWLGLEKAIFLLYFLDQALLYFKAKQESSQGSSRVLNWMVTQMKVFST